MYYVIMHYFLHLKHLESVYNISCDILLAIETNWRLIEKVGGKNYWL